MSKPDWSKAPEGATHWGPENYPWGEWWYRLIDGECHRAADQADTWGTFSASRDGWKERLSQLIPRPAKPRWRYHWGGPCPVDPLQRVNVLFREGYATAPASAFNWDTDNDPGDIIAYRIL